MSLTREARDRVIPLGTHKIESTVRYCLGGRSPRHRRVVVFAWGAWLLVAGWRAYAGEAAAAGPASWWLALAIDLLLIGAFALLWIIIEIEGFRLF